MFVFVSGLLMSDIVILIEYISGLIITLFNNFHDCVLCVQNLKSH